MKIERYKWIMLAMLSAAFFFHQADRALFGLLTLPIQNELGLTDVQIGWINTALSWTLAGMAFVAGPIGDRFSRKWLITGSLIAWSLMTVMMGFVGDWTIFGFMIPAFFVVMFFRSFATGVGESFYGPCYAPLISAYHKATRSIAMSIHQGALYFGLMISGVMTAWALAHFGGWRQVFMLFGGAGLLLGISFIFFLKDSNSDTQREKHESLFAGFAYYFRTPSAILSSLSFVGIVFVNNAYLFWAPKFMSEKFGTSVGTAGIQTMFYHHLFAFAAILAGGVISDRFVKRMPRFRIGLEIVTMLLGAPCLLMVGLAPTAIMMVVMTAAYGVFRGAYEANTYPVIFDVIPPKYRSTSVGITTLICFLFGGLSGILMGWLSQHYGVKGFEIGFAIMGGVYVICALMQVVQFFFTFHRDRITE